MSIVTADPKDLTANIALRRWVKQGQFKKTVAVKTAVDFFLHSLICSHYQPGSGEWEFHECYDIILIFYFVLSPLVE